MHNKTLSGEPTLFAKLTFAGFTADNTVGSPLLQASLESSLRLHPAHPILAMIVSSLLCSFSFHTAVGRSIYMTSDLSHGPNALDPHDMA